jgi:AbrB family looped-hinge helix DNA binding protein
MSVATVTSKGQITIPVDIRQLLHLKPGDKIDFQVDEGGIAKLFPISRRVADVFGILEVKGQEAIPTSEIDERLAKAFRGRRG